jgi:uncharacterized surface protein with fasciclin (FAS1) repeats
MTISTSKALRASAAALFMLVGAFALVPAASQAQDAPMVGGAPMMPTMTIVENASKANNLTTLVSAVQQAELVETLSGEGPFTVFAPTNEAFEALPDGTVETVMKDENKAMLQGVLTYHVVPGRLTAERLMAEVEKGGGKIGLQTASGETVNLMMQGDRLVLQDANGGTATVAQADVMQSNGVVHVIDGVLMPKM